MILKLIFHCKILENKWKKIGNRACYYFSNVIHYECRQMQTSVYKQNKLITCRKEFNTMENSRRMVTIKELEQYLKISRPTIARWRKEEGLPYYKFQGSVRFDLDEIDEWLKNKRG